MKTKENWVLFFFNMLSGIGASCFYIAVIESLQSQIQELNIMFRIGMAVLSGPLIWKMMSINWYGEIFEAFKKESRLKK